ncbi:MAG: type II toxin-antitoxin system HicA family toxin [Chloroflexi bacterium]|nr:type II toxin-antitoxin system HicA family toxin [Chloroflexota bacterium]
MIRATIYSTIGVVKEEKLTKKFVADKKHVTVEDCEKLLVLHGYERHKSRGSHYVYHKKGENPITVVIPKKTKYVKPGYVDRIIKRLDLEQST